MTHIRRVIAIVIRLCKSCVFIVSKSESHLESRGEPTIPARDPGLILSVRAPFLSTLPVGTSAGIQFRQVHMNDLALKWQLLTSEVTQIGLNESVRKSTETYTAVT